MTADENNWISIRSTLLSARIDPFGAQLSRLQDADGHDLLWNGDPTFWNGRAPLLFPIVGALSGGVYRWRGRSYALSRHGFARNKTFEVIQASSESVLLRLHADQTTVPLYPFEFVLDVRFSLAGATLAVRVSIRNDTDEPMLSSFGFHPAFRWPLPYAQSRDTHRIDFPNDEPAPIRRLDAQGLIEPDALPSPIQQRRLVLNDSLFARDALVLDQVQSRYVTYGAEHGPRIRVDFPHCPYLGVWSKPGAPFICIEPWQGIADPEGFTGSLDQKPGIFGVEPGGSHDVAVDISLLADS